MTELKWFLLAAIALLAGCRSNMTLAKPVDPKMIAVQTRQDATLNVVVQVDTFSLGKIKTNFGSHDMEQFRTDIPVIIGNGIFSLLAGGNVFRTVKRTAVGPPADFIVSGTYDHSSYLGTGGREWIPFAGTFGAPINEATVHEVLHVIVLNVKTGRSILDQKFSEHQKEWSTVYSIAQANWLQPNFLAKVSQAITEAIRPYATNSPVEEGSRHPASNVESKPQANELHESANLVHILNTPVIPSINGRVANLEFFIDDEIDPSKVSDSLGKCGSTKAQTTFSRTATSYVWFCVSIVPDGKFSEGSATFTMAMRRDEDRSLVTWLPAVTLKVKQDSPYGTLLSGYGAKERGKIEVGKYVVEVFSNNEKVGEGSFEVL